MSKSIKGTETEKNVLIAFAGFDWDGRIAVIPGVAARVHDAYVMGEGILHVSISGLFTLANLRDTDDMAEGEMMHFVAEAAWYPTVLLPSQGVR